MSELDVRIVRLEPMRVASALGFGESPEPIAWKKLLTWAETRGLLDDLDSVRFFGFNNPNPSPGSPNYGYEQWITVGPDVTAEGDVEIKEFAGGLYAVTRCKSIHQIMEIWKSLGAWLKESSYKMGQHQWLEECLTKPTSAELEEIPLEDFEMDLYCPIQE
jgi:DNA gyrase inhibitor GyrI